MATEASRWWSEAVAWHSVSGADASRVLNNLSTQDLVAPKVEEARWAAFVDHKGLLLDLWRAFRHEDGWWAEGLVERGETTWAWVDRHVITEEVTHEAMATQGFRALGEGPETWAQTHSLGDFPRQGLVAGAPHAWAWWEGQGAGLRLVAPIGEAEALAGFLEGQGWLKAEASVVETWRLQQGRPAWASELQGRNPWACRLDQAVALAKGCYLGQEVIARLHHYAKVPQGLVGVAGQGPMPEVGDVLAHASGKPGGKFSSVVGHEGAWSALAFVSATVEQAGFSWAGHPVAVGDRPYWAGRAEPLTTRAAGLMAPASGPAPTEA